MKNYISLSAVIMLCAASEIYPHAVPTHHNITRRAVEYLRTQAPEFSCFNDSQVQIGTANEDDYPRFMFHFFPALNAGPFSTTCNSLQWGFTLGATCTENGAPAFRQTLTNDHTWPVAVQHARDPITMAPSDLGWVDLGFVLHLLEDMTSPAHTRNDPHPPGDGDPVEAETRDPNAPSGGLVSFSSPQEFLASLQAWTQSNFFSKDTCFDTSLPGPVAASSDSHYFYDAIGNRIAYKGLRYRLSGLTDATRDRTKTTIDDVIADQQFVGLGTQAVLYAASFMHYYYKQASPLISAIKNGSFESGDLTGWIPDTTFGYDTVTSEDRIEGRYAARIGRWDQPYRSGGCFRCGPVPGAEPDGADFIYQDVDLPEDATSLTLTFDYNLVTYDGAAYDWFDMIISDADSGVELARPVSQVGGIIAGSIFNWGLFYTTGWRRVSVDLTPFKGRKVRLLFSVTQDGFGDQIATYIDNVTLGCSF